MVLSCINEVRSIQSQQDEIRILREPLISANNNLQHTNVSQQIIDEVRNHSIFNRECDE